MAVFESHDLYLRPSYVDNVCLGSTNHLCTSYLNTHLRLSSTQDEYVCLNQIRTIDYRRLDSKLGQIDSDDFDRVREAPESCGASEAGGAAGGGREWVTNFGRGGNEFCTCPGREF